MFVPRSQFQLAFMLWQLPLLLPTGFLIFSIMWLYGNTFSGSIPDAWSTLIKLQYVDESAWDAVSVRGVRRTVFRCVRRELLLWGCQLTGTVPTYLGTFTDLSVLSLAGNGMSGSLNPIGLMINLRCGRPFL